jgi:hypothetical protein
MAEKLTLKDTQPDMGATSEGVSLAVMDRLGLLPRKRGSTESMHQVLLEFYARAKKATAAKDPKLSVMTVDEMAIFAKITRQTMYEYLQRWLTLHIITKVSFIDEGGKVIIGYKLNGTTIEDAFSKVETRIKKNVEDTKKLIVSLQKMLKNEKISASMKKDV